jgi:PAS domain S-box-containing protein
VTAVTSAWPLTPLLAGAVLLGAVIFAGLVSRERTRSRAQQQALRDSEKRLRLALDATTEVVWDLDLTTGALSQPRWAQIYGYPEHANPRTMEQLVQYIHPEDRAVVMEQSMELVSGERDVMEVEHRLRAASGEWRWTLGRSRVVARDASGRALRIVGTCADITERKKMIERLQIADRMASVGTLAAGVAHEINNPLAYLMGNLGFALETIRATATSCASGTGTHQVVGAALDECSRALQEAEDGAQRVRRIVRDLRVLSRGSDEKRVPLDVRAVIAGALNLADSEVRQRASVSTEMAEVPLVVADEARLSQVFVNLLINAAQAIAPGHPESNEIRVAVHPGPPGQVVVEVADTGCGIPEEDRKRIFDPFFTTKPVGVGTGLGLAICHGIVTALGGEIGVESTPGRGSTFRVTLPAATVRALVSEPKPVVRRATRRGRILVVDDEPLFCRTLVRMLAVDHDVVALGDPAEALRRVTAGERFDLMLTDLIMPEMTGMELYAGISRVAPELAARTYFVTGGAFTPAALEFVRTRADRILEKPLAAEALLAAVAAALS